MIMMDMQQYEPALLFSALFSMLCKVLNTLQMHMVIIDVPFAGVRIIFGAPVSILLEMPNTLQMDMIINTERELCVIELLKYQ